MREVIPIRIMANLNADGTIKDFILQYKIKTDGVTENKFYSAGLQNSMSPEMINAINAIVSDAIGLANQGEGI